jgi:hypothetical protein
MYPDADARSNARMWVTEDRSPGWEAPEEKCPADRRRTCVRRAPNHARPSSCTRRQDPHSCRTSRSFLAHASKEQDVERGVLGTRGTCTGAGTGAASRTPCTARRRSSRLGICHLEATRLLVLGVTLTNHGRAGWLEEDLVERGAAPYSDNLMAPGDAHPRLALRGRMLRPVLKLCIAAEHTLQVRLRFPFGGGRASSSPAHIFSTCNTSSTRFKSQREHLIRN